ncbi:2-keto-3-deoxygluconate permease domain protein [Bordetella pertussis STO1-CHOC-0017]|nr:2-keto-3-deoxygluconate permease domain protein [Bordetella pertussis STO1-CHOC-0017]
MTTEVSRVPFYTTMMKVPGGLMLLPLILGSLLGTFAPDALAIGGFTTALFKNSALPLIALLIFATGTQVNMRTGGPILATAGTILLMKTLVPATLIILLGHFVGLDGVLGISILAMLAAFDNSNGGLWLAYTGQYGDSRDRGAYVASAVNDGPFFSLLFLGASGLADIPTIALVAALVPFLLGVVVGNLGHRMAQRAQAGAQHRDPVLRLCAGHRHQPGRGDLGRHERPGLGPADQPDHRRAGVLRLPLHPAPAAARAAWALPPVPPPATPSPRRPWWPPPIRRSSPMSRPRPPRWPRAC